MFFKKDYLALFFLFFLFLTTHFVGIDRGFWQDEFISLNSLNNNFFINPLYFGYTTNLPLYFVLLKIITFWGFFTNFFYLRFISIIISYFTTLSIYFFLKKEFGFYFSLVFTILFIITPLQIHYSQEVRPYALAQLFIILTCIAFYYFLKNKLDLKIFYTLTFLTFFTHYSGIIFLGLLYFLSCLYFYFVKNKKQLKNFFGLLMFVGFLGILSLYTYSYNPSFFNALEKSTGRGLDLTRVYLYPRDLLVGGIARIKEVVTFYYFFGLWYYLVDPLIQSVFKKFILLSLFSGFFFELYKLVRFKKLSIYWVTFVLFFGLMICGYFLEFVGVYPFGGRHIFAYSFLYYFVLLYPFKDIKNVKIQLSILLFVLFLLLPLFIFHQKCSNWISSQFLQIKVEQKDSYKYCIQNTKKLFYFN